MLHLQVVGPGKQGGLKLPGEADVTLFSGPNNLKVKHYLKSAAIYYPNWDMDYALGR